MGWGREEERQGRRKEGEGVKERERGKRRQKGPITVTGTLRVSVGEGKSLEATEVMEKTRKEKVGVMRSMKGSEERNDRQSMHGY